MLIAVRAARTIGVESEPWLRFGEESKATGAWAGRRVLFVKDRPAFELSFWCGTCPLLFRRLDGADEGGSVEDLDQRLSDGISGFDDEVIKRFASVLPRGDYIPLLLRVQPRLIMPVLAGDYFAEEQVETWGVNGFWGLPEYPHTPYYRTFETPVGHDGHLYEFVVPMVPPSWNDRGRVNEFMAALATSNTPTAVAVAVLDVCQPANATGADYYAHWALTHFLLDGHHKMEAAATSGRAVQLLTLLSVGAGLGTLDQVARIPELRAQPRRVRTRT
jgi:hypothetical protein